MKDAFDTSDWNESKRALREKDIQGPCVAKARWAGWLARKLSSYPGNVSLPDYMFGRDGRVVFVEFKRPGGKPTKRQEEEHKAFREAGLDVFVVDSREQFDSIMGF